MSTKKQRDKIANLEKEHLLNPETAGHRKKKKRKKAVIIVIATILGVIFLLAVTYMAAGAVGKYRLKNNAQIEAPVLDTVETEIISEEEEEIWQPGWVKYKGQIYAYNEDILTFLFMGIDKNEEQVTAVAEGTNGGQADALFLLLLNPHDKSVSVLAINRNTMTDIDVYNEEGSYVNTITAQIAVQHGFGNGMEESCRYQVDAVRKLLYDVPIHGYCAINAKAVIPITDMVGGVELTVLEDVQKYGSKSHEIILTEGETKVLDGENSYSYVRFRDVSIEKSANGRLERQKQWLTAFMKQVKEQTAADISLPVKLYNEITNYMVTDVSVDEVAYLTSIASGYTFEKEHMYSLTGETVMGEKFEEFYVDEEALYELILQLFYEPVAK